LEKKGKGEPTGSVELPFVRLLFLGTPRLYEICDTVRGKGVIAKKGSGLLQRSDGSTQGNERKLWQIGGSFLAAGLGFESHGESVGRGENWGGTEGHFGAKGFWGEH